MQVWEWGSQLSLLSTPGGGMDSWERCSTPLTELWPLQTGRGGGQDPVWGLEGEPSLLPEIPPPILYSFPPLAQSF